MCVYFWGQLHQIAGDFYGIPLIIEQLPLGELVKGEGFQFSFRLNFDNRDYLSSRQLIHSNDIQLEHKVSPGGSSGLTPIQHSTLLTLFPFALVFRPDLCIIAAGNQLRRMYPDESLVHQPMHLVTKMRRPKVTMTWSNVSFASWLSNDISKDWNRFCHLLAIF